MESNTTEETTTTQIGENQPSFSSPIPPDPGYGDGDDDDPQKQGAESSSHLTPETQSDTKGLRTVTIVCTKCHRHEVQILPPDFDDSCLIEIPKEPKVDYGKNGLPFSQRSEDTKETCTSRRKKYDAATREKLKCVPVTGPVTEYKDAYRNPDYPNAKSPSDRPQFHPPQRTIKRPPWNPSISLPPPPYPETLHAIEAKLKVLDEAEDPPPNVLALAIQRQNLREKYRQRRNGACGDGQAECGACDDEIGPRDSEISSPPPPPCWLRTKPMVFVQGSHIELFEDESLLSDV